VFAFQVKLGANDLNCVDVPLNPTHSLTVTTVSSSGNITSVVIINISTTPTFFDISLTRSSATA